MSRYYTRQETLIKHPAALNEGSLCLLGLHGTDKKSHPWHLRCNAQDNNIGDLQDFDTSRTERR